MSTIESDSVRSAVRPSVLALTTSQKRHMVFICGLLLALGAISVDITLPFFPGMAASLAEPVTSMHATISWYIAALGVGQLVLGTVSDRFGRKPILLVGLFLFASGSVMAGIADSLNTMIGARVVQGFGGAAGAVLGRAVLRDLFEGEELAHNMSLAMAIFSIGPIVGPLVGVALVEIGGSWRFVFYVICLYAVCLMAVVYRLPETLSQKRLDALKPKVLRLNVAEIFRHPVSRYFLLVFVVNYISMILVVAHIPAIFERQFGVSGAVFAIIFALHGCGIIIGQWLNRRLIPQVGVIKASLYAVSVMVLSPILTLLLQGLGLLDAYSLGFMIFMLAIGFLVVTSNTLSVAMTPLGHIAGFASSFIGASGQIVSGVISALLAPVIQGQVVAWALAMLIISGLTTILLVFAQNRVH